MAAATNTTTNLQAGDYPPGYTPGEGFANDGPSVNAMGAADPASDATPVPLNLLTARHQQWIDCPNCKKRVKTNVVGRSEGKQKFMNVFWWPLPDRKHWWELTRWHCSNCEILLANQKHTKEIQVLV